jgi:predicted porin
MKMKTKKIGVASFAIGAAVAGVSMVAATPAAAQSIDGSAVQIYGLVGTYVGESRRSGSGAGAVVEGSGGLTTSYWGISGREDIGGGNAVIFRLESFFQPNNGGMGRKSTDPFLSRNAYVGITTHMGTLTLGRQTNPTYVIMQELNPFGSSVVFSPLVLQSFVANYNGVLIGDTVWDNAVQYSSPVIGGFKGNVIYGVGGVAGEPGIANLGLHGSYQSGGFYAGVSLQRVRTPVTSPMTEENAWLGGVRYKTKYATAYAAIEGTQTYGSRSGSHTYELGLSVPTGVSGAVLAEWARTSLNGASANKTWIRNTAAIGYDYFLSKRTDVYAICLYDKLTGHGSATTESVGIRHKF